MGRGLCKASCQASTGSGCEACYQACSRCCGGKACFDTGSALAEIASICWSLKGVNSFANLKSLAKFAQSRISNRVIESESY